jgi:hypothetical protein
MAPMLSTGELLGALNLAGAGVVAGIALTSGNRKRTERDRDARAAAYLGDRHHDPQPAGLASWPTSR